MDVSPDHEPTLIERGTDIHLNHPLSAQRGIHDSRPARWESWTPHLSTLRKGGEGAHKQVRELAPITSSGPRLGGLDARLHLLDMHRTRANDDTCAWHCRGRLKQTPRTPATRCGKTLLDCTRSTKASGATPAGALARPHGTAQQPGGKKVPSARANLRGFLTDTTAKARGLLSGADIGVP
jgi:hypothetical protein